jgi:hypothetical protein
LLHPEDPRRDQPSFREYDDYVRTERQRSRERDRDSDGSIAPQLSRSGRPGSESRSTTRRSIRSNRARTSDRTRRERSPSLEDRQVLKFYLSRQAPVVDAPTIGPSTAKKLIPIGIRTVGDLLDGSAERIAAELGHPRITAEVVRQWQREASFVCRVPNLRGHDAQILVASGIHEPEELSRFSPRQLLERVAPFFDTVEGRRVLRGNSPPDQDEVARWIEWSRSSRTIAAA